MLAKGVYMAAPKSKNKGKHRVLFILEMLLLVLFIGILSLYGQITQRIGSLSTSSEGEEFQARQDFDEAGIVMNHTAPRMTGYRTVAFFGLDHRAKNEEMDGENSDTIIICSVNNDTQEVRMVSIYRDTLLDIGNDIYAKANAAYAYGGPVQAVSMLNTNLDLNITDYVTVDFNAVAELVDAVDGLDIPLSYAEIVHMNNYCVETSEETGKDYVPIELPGNEPADLEKVVGTYHLNGVQATSYCRIRYTASMDMGRTERQRRVIQMVVQKLKTTGLARIFRIMDAVFPMIRTSLTKTEILSMIPQMISYKIDETTGFPFRYKFSDIKGSIIVADTLKDNVTELHDFLYGKQENYFPSENIGEISARILEIVGGEGELQENAPVIKEGTGIDDFFWSYGSSTGNDAGGIDNTYTADGISAAPSGDEVSSYEDSYDIGSYGYGTGDNASVYTGPVDDDGGSWTGQGTGYDPDQGGGNAVYPAEDEASGGSADYDDGYDLQPDAGYAQGGADGYESSGFADGDDGAFEGESA